MSSPELMHLAFTLAERDRLMNPDARARAALRGNRPRRPFRAWLETQRQRGRRTSQRRTAPAYEAGGAV